MNDKYKDGDLSSKQKKKLDLDIREMEIDDLAAVFHLGEELYTSEDVPNLYRTWDEYEVVSLFHENSEFCLVAESEEDGKIIGFIFGNTVTKSHSAWKYGIVAWIGVDPDYHGHGAATKLYKNLLDLMIEDGVRILLMDTQAHNKPAVEFFKKMGFGNIQKHIYMSMNISMTRSKPHKKKSEKDDI